MKGCFCFRLGGDSDDEPMLVVVVVVVATLWIVVDAVDVLVGTTTGCWWGGSLSSSLALGWEVDEEVEDDCDVAVVGSSMDIMVHNKSAP